MPVSILSVSWLLLSPEVVRAAQDTGPAPTERRLERSEGDSGGPGSLAALAGHWATRLTHHDHDRREASFEAFVEEARSNLELRAMARDWRQEPTELGWTARLALRTLESEDLRENAREPSRPSPFLDLRSGRIPRILGPSPLDAFEEHSRQLEQMLESLGGSNPASLGQGAVRSGSSTSITQGPDGIRVEITTHDEDGSQQSEVFEGSTLEDLVAGHPELKERLEGRSFALGGPGAHDLGIGLLRLNSFDAEFERMLEAWPRRSNSGLWSQRTSRPRGEGPAPLNAHSIPLDRLGVLIDTEAPGPGLLVQSVEGGSLAQALGIRAGERIRALCGRAIAEVADVGEALGSRKPDEPVTGQVEGVEGTLRDLRWEVPGSPR